ncbi:MAG TPA: amidohydrolase family protein [Patescibacteria group bacterium]|nr:amidohydrolase family protein [Patescibacteria group bacterium]
MVIDCHTHIDKTNEKDWKPEDLIAAMDEASIDYSIVIENHRSIPPLDQLIAITKKYQRFFALANISLDSFDDQYCKKLMHHLKQNDIVGIKLFPGYEDYYPYDERFSQILRFCEDNGYPLMIHTGVLMIGCKGHLEQAQPLHVDRIAHAYPNLKIIIAHMGNPWLTDTVAVMWKNPNVYTDLSAFFVENQPIDPKDVMLFLARMRDMKDFLGSFKRCLFGTDWPLYSQKEYLDAVKQIGLTDEERELIYWKNATELFKLPVQ